MSEKLLAWYSAENIDTCRFIKNIRILCASPYGLAHLFCFCITFPTYYLCEKGNAFMKEVLIMKASYHNGRVGNPHHNDRTFNLDKAPHIDQSLTPKNRYFCTFPE